MKTRCPKCGKQVSVVDPGEPASPFLSKHTRCEVIKSARAYPVKFKRVECELSSLGIRRELLPILTAEARRFGEKSGVVMRVPTKGHASLITAAPELLAACKKVAESIDKDGRVYLPANGYVIKFILGAIAKAEGGAA